MFNSYGIYKNVRDASWQTLIDFKISILPVDVVFIATESNISIVKNCDVKELKENESGVSILHGREWFIVYDETMNKGRIMFTIAHELGHIFLGHPIKAGYHTRTIDISKPQTESEADMYAIRLLAPACVLWGLDIHTTEEISELCCISKSAASYRAQRMSELYKRDRFLTSPLERTVFNQFEEFIRKNKK